MGSSPCHWGQKDSGGRVSPRPSECVQMCTPHPPTLLPGGPSLRSVLRASEEEGPYHDSRAMTRSPSPCAWTPDFPGTT